MLVARINNGRPTRGRHAPPRFEPLHALTLTWSSLTKTLNTYNLEKNYPGHLNQSLLNSIDL